MKRSISVVLSLLTMLLVPSDARAQAGSKTAESISVSYVLVPFVALDRRGRPVTNVRPQDVALMVDGQRVRPDLFDRSNDAPVSFTILLDGSGSMGLAGKMEGARVAIQSLIANRLEGDDYSLYVFARKKVTQLVPFTGDGSRILQALGKVKPFGKTALYDALVRMPDETLLGTNGSRAIILLTDGLDNASFLDRMELAKIFEAVDVPVYPLGLRPSSLAPVESSRTRPRETDVDVAVLGELAQMSGGRIAVSTDAKQLEAAVRTILQDLRAQYLIGFTPTGKGAIRYRPITLTVSGKTRSVRVRRGYRGTEPALLVETSKKKR